MADVRLKSTVVYATEEVTEGTVVDPSAGDQAVGIVSDGFAMNPERETVERNLLRAGIQRQVPRVGIKSASATIGVEFSANSVAGAEPDYDLFMQSLLGGKRQNSSEVTTKATGNTTSVLQIEDADIANFKVGDIIVVKEATAYHISPIIAVDDTLSSANITLLVAASSSFSASVVIEKFTTYYGTDTGHKSITLTAFMEDLKKLQAGGMKVASMSMDGFETGQSPTLSFTFAGLSYTEEGNTASGLTASTSDALPPIALKACLYKNGTQLPVRSIGLSIDNTVGRKTSTCSANGIIAQAMTERAVSGNLTPYVDTVDDSIFDDFDANNSFSLFFSAYNPTSTAGEFENAWGVFIPNVVITALPMEENDGLMSYALDWQAGQDETGTYSSEIYFSFA